METSLETRMFGGGHPLTEAVMTIVVESFLTVKGVGDFPINRALRPRYFIDPTASP
jgi:hypothetical protein